MPNMANLTVKKADGTTDIVYTGMTAAAGDGSFAVWRGLSHAAQPTFQPEFRLKTQPNGDRTARRGEGHFSFPAFAQDAAANNFLVGRFNLKVTWSCDDAIPTTVAKEAAYQALNILANALTKEQVAGGYAAS